MQTDAARKLIRETFEKPFDKQQFSTFIKNLLNHVEEAPFTYRGNLIFDDFKDRVESLERIGKYTDRDGSKADILVVHLKRTTSLDRARTAQRQFVAKYLKGSRGGEMKDAALVAFVSPDEEDWRFSFVKMEYKIETTDKGRIKAIEEFTPAKRYSFLVGKNENSHTAQSQLLPILEDTDKNPTLKDIESRFSVEKVTKEFFEKYRELFLEIKEALDNLVKKDKKIKADFESKGVETIDFAKKLLGQIVFLYFLQKKGWFGVARNAAWGTGPKNFLRMLCDQKLVDYDNFFNEILEPLFYEALASEREADYYSKFKCKVPFLNGGLFDPLNNYDWVHTDILLPNELFSNKEKTKHGDVGTGILDVFDRYNFTVKEDEPLEKEVAVDPEMLGKVFENLLEVKDRKSKGTYYTPREIVHYMCQESIINYLATELEGVISHDDLETLIKHGESAVDNDIQVLEKGRETSDYSFKLPDSIREHAATIDRKLADIKVCDPAVGSGAFLVGMMTEIIRTRSVLTEFLDQSEGRSAYDLKRHAIQNSLYGVDIDPGAVEIAKLRLWLSMIVDEDDYRQIKPLPNLDYKIMQGNSLLEEYEGIKLIDERFFAKTENKVIEQKRLQGIQSELQREYFTLHSSGKLSPVKKLEIEKRLREIEKQLFSLDKPGDQDSLPIYAKPEAQSKAEKLLKLLEEFFATYHKREKDKLKEQIDHLTWDLIEATLKQEKKSGKLTDLKQFQKTNTRPFFLWKLNFAEIFQKRNGFDIAIANPPYLESRHPSFDIQFKEALQQAVKNRWPHDSSKIQRGSDLLIYFIELALHIINPSGSVIYLTQNSWLDTEYGRQFQAFLLDHTNVRAIVDSDYKYFDAKTGPNINTVITIFTGSRPSKSFPVAFARFHRDLLPYAGKVCSTPLNMSADVAEVKHFEPQSNMLVNQKWGTLLAMSKAASQLINSLNKNARILAEVDKGNFVIGQGLNLTKEYLCEYDIIRKEKILIEAAIPILSSADGAPFLITRTRYCLLDSAKINLKTLKATGLSKYKLFSKSDRPVPRLILPRGIGRHYCAWNDIGAYSSSGVDIYVTGNTLPEDTLLRLWAFLNSSPAWLLREISGRKNLGGGMLKAEAVDLRQLPIYLELPLMPIKQIFKEAKNRQADRPLLELNSEIHGAIDELVFNYLEISDAIKNGIVDDLKKTIESRQAKSRT